MIRLVVQNQVTGSLQELDTFGNENISLTLQVDDVKDIESKHASYSKDFNLPATKNNNKFFEHYYNLDRYKTNFNAYKNVKAYLYSDEVLVLEGFLRLLNVVDKDTEITYNVVLFNDVANIIETLADATIKDLDLSDIDHNITESNVYNSWSATGVTLEAGGTSIVPFYPLTNNGNLIADINGEISINPYEHYILNVQLKYIIDKIFNYAGFTYNSSFFNSTLFSEIYFDTTINTDIGDDNITNVIIATGVDNVSPQLALGWNSAYDFPLLNYTNETGDDNNDFNHDTSVFTAPFDCILDINAFIYVDNNFAFGSQINLNVNTVNLLGNPVYYVIDTTYAQPNTQSSLLLNGQVIVPQGATAFIGFTCPNNAGGDQVYFIPSPFQDYRLTLKVLPYNLTDEAINTRLGDIKLADIIKDVTKLFNLTIESQNNNTLLIEPFDTYTSNSKIVDWTKKINSNEFIIEPIDIPKRIEFKHALEDDDYMKNRYNKANVIDYGSQVLEFDVDNDEIKIIETEVFSAPYIFKINGTNIFTQWITKYEDGTHVPYDNKPRLVFKRNTIYDDNVFYDNDEFFSTGSWETNYANATMYDDDLVNATSQTNSLLFGLINTTNLDSVLATQPTNTLFNVYWFNYINEKYNFNNGLILKAEFYLKPTDIYNFSFADKVKIQDQLYRVNKIEYNTDKNSLAKVELLRI